ncbi:zinc finger MYM-type protein 1-like [Diabrotica virgifera virgifera]|uniref:DUF4371 domain-containing protein n=1 Tax=Diabrotica virgifera virgifera TaxID=50390 RepID=A0ABM5K427_DIAVI|nr:zinc finger MYM-type protein 1-like [Diabrotica virgifera virgifera]
MEGRKQPGSFWHKRNQEKQERQNKILKGIPKMTAFFTPDGNQEDDTTNISQPGSSSSATSDKYIHIQPHELILETSELVPEPEHLVSPVSKVLEYEEATTSNSDPKQDLLNFKDPALWQDSHNYAEIILEKWVEQNLTDMDFSMSKRNFGEQHRYAGKQIFYKRLVNGEVVRRDWAIYSESTGNIFCLFCVLFGNKKNQFKTGFSLWNKSKERLDEHERSNDHIDNLKMYMTRLLKQGRVDVELEKEISTAKEYWVKVLERIISVIKFLATRELAFRGTHEIISEKRNGDYLGLLELLSEYDPFLKDHINKRANLGKGKTSYLSKDICNELLNILSNRVIDEIVRQIKANKYYSIRVDSTPDITHHDQLTVILKYCDNKGNPVERFVGFYKNTGHSSQQLEETVIGMLESLKLDIKNCRGQSYDNASNMSGKYSGLQERIKAYNDLAIFVPCAAHSLNLVVQNAADCCLEATFFFMLVQAIYNFFPCLHIGGSYCLVQ